MTEDEAFSNWCPFARVALSTGDIVAVDLIEGARGSVCSANRHTDIGGDMAHAQCIGSGCMAWRWDPQKISLVALLEKAERGESGDTAPSAPPVRHGHCGLAGPEA